MPTSDYHIGDWTIRAQRCVIEFHGRETHVSPKAMAVLQQLAEARGEVVSRNDLFDRVWHGAAVSDDALTQTVVELRRAFGDAPRDPQVIETIPKKGLRLVPAVRDAGKASIVPPAATRVSPRRRLQRPVLLATLLAAAALLIVAGINFGRHNEAAPAAAAQRQPSLVVLPFVDASLEGNQYWFAQGLTEHLIDRLMHIDGLKIVDTGSVLQADTAASAPAAGARLDADHVLRGSVHLLAESVRVTAQLLDRHSGEYLWSTIYERPRADIFEIQDDIAESVAAALSVALGVGELASMEGMTKNVAALDAIYRIGEDKDQSGRVAWAEAEKQLLLALEIDPEFGLAWAALAHLYRTSRWTIEGFPWRERAEPALQNALRLAPNSAYVHNVAAQLYVDFGDWQAAQQSLDRAVELSGAHDAYTREVQVDIFAKLGRAAEARPLAELWFTGKTLAFHHMFLGHVLAMQGQVGQALEVYEAGYALPRGDVNAHDGLITSLATDDRALQALWLERAATVESMQADNLVFVVMSERFDDRQSALEWLRSAFESSTVSDYWIAIWAAFYGDTELALAALDRTPDGWAMWVPVMAEVRKAPGFARLVEKHGLVAYWRRFGWGDFCRPGAGETIECA